MGNGVKYAAVAIAVAGTNIQKFNLVPLARHERSTQSTADDRYRSPVTSFLLQFHSAIYR